MVDLGEKVSDFHVRLGRLEDFVYKKKIPNRDSWIEDTFEFILTIVALSLCYVGLGLPNHYYQYLFSSLIVLCLYHRKTFPLPKNWSEYLLLFFNVLLISILLKLIIGGGEPRPFSWFSYPTLEGGVTSFKLSWQKTTATDWELPLTLIQSFFLTVTLFGTMIGFSLLAGLTSFILVLLAVPSLIDFNWNWAMPGMIFAIASIYLQMQTYEDS